MTPSAKAGVKEGADGTHLVTGAYGYSGKYIAAELLQAGQPVRTLTNSPHRANPFRERVEASAFHFEDTDALCASFDGVSAFYNTYWVRFGSAETNYEQAVQNSLRLFGCARRTGIKRIVHLSITNPSRGAHLPYFRGKARLERALQEMGISHAILRPTVLFGGEGILINNIAWFLRRFPFFGLFGDGRYRLQPIHVRDLARLAVEQGQRDENVILNAIGTETYTYRELVEQIAASIGVSRPLIPMPDSLVYLLGRILGFLLRDIVVTREEMQGLKAELLYTASPATGRIRLSEWLKANADTLGKRYASELARRRNRTEAYERL